MTDDWLRDALDDAVSDVEPREALDSIRSRTKVTPMSSKRPWIYGATGAVLATAATITAFALVNTGGSPNAGDDTGVVNQPTQTEPEPSDQGPSPIEDPVTIPVYYLGEVTYHAGESGDMQTGLRLYREWKVTEGARSAVDVASSAVHQMLEAPSDPDYVSPWSNDMDVRWVKHEGGLITVSLIGKVQESSVGAEGAELAVQQLIYTIQGALSVMDDPAATDPVRIFIDGQPADDLWGHVDISEPIARADQLDVQAPVWITEPAEGAAVPATTTVKGVASVFEATVSWRLLKDGVEVDSGSTMASAGGPAFGDYEFELTNLEPGSYVLQAFEASALDGSDTFMDTKSFTVE